MAGSTPRPQNKCFPAILRRLLCTGSLPTHPSDLIADAPSGAADGDPLPGKSAGAGKAEGDRGEESSPAAPAATASSTPGIVARLMGLDSMPGIGWGGAGRGAAQGSLLGRSRSMNSLEYLMRFETMQAAEGFRAGTSSFREVPTSLHRMDFFAECLGGEPKQGAGAERRSTAESGIRKESSCRKNKKPPKGKGDDNLNGLSSELQSAVGGLPPKNRDAWGRRTRPVSKAGRPTKPIRRKEGFVNPTHNKKKMSDGSVDKMAPVSDLSYYRTDPEISTHSGRPALSENVSGTSRRRKNKRTPASPRVEKSDHKFPNQLLLPRIEEVQESGADGEAEARAGWLGAEARRYSELLCRICRLADEDAMGTARAGWVPRVGSGYDEHAEMCRDFGEQIVEQLVCQFVDELWGVFGEKSATQ